MIAELMNRLLRMPVRPFHPFERADDGRDRRQPWGPGTGRASYAVVQRRRAANRRARAARRRSR